MPEVYENRKEYVSAETVLLKPTSSPYVALNCVVKFRYAVGNCCSVITVLNTPGAEDLYN